MTRACLLLVLALLAVPRVASAQASKEKDVPVPKGSLPPAGMCRIWLDNVPAARQPAPTDCPSAIRNRPPNARVIFPAREARPATPARGTAPARPDSAKRRPPR